MPPTGLASTSGSRLASLFVLLWALSAILTGCSSTRHAAERPPAILSKPVPSVSPFPDLKARIDGLLPDSLFPPSNAAVMVISLKDDRTIYELNPDLLFMPASNEKLFTSAAALSVLGPDYRFATSVSMDTSNVPQIFVRGGGDPLLSTGDLDSLAKIVAAALPHDKTWLLGGDVSLFDDVPWGEGWMWDDEAESDGMAITPLSLNGNTVRIIVRGGDKPGDTLAVRVEPVTGYVTIDNNGTTAGDSAGEPLKVTRRLTDQSNTILVTGTIRCGDSASAHISVHEPVWYALRVFSERLAEYGIHCSGTVLDTVPSTAHPLGSLYRTLDTIVTNMNRVSDNLSAECLVKTLGAVRTGSPGSAASGISAIKQYLAAQAVDTARMVIADGSGVSRYNLNSVRNIATLLRQMHGDQRLFPLFYNSLAAPGEHGSLSNRMKGTSAEGSLRAKTGTLRGAAALSGYITTPDGTLLAFSIIMQNYVGNPRRYRQIQDEIAVLLSQWTE